MKKIVFGFLMLSTIALTMDSCKKTKTTTTTTTPKEEVITINQEGIKSLPEIPALPASMPITIKDTLKDEIDATLAQNGATRNQITKVFAKNMNVDIVGTGQTFDFIDDSVKIYVNKIGASNPILVASKYGIPLGATSIALDVIQTDVKDIFLSDNREMILKFNSRPNQGIAANSQFHYKLGFEVTVLK